MTNRTDAQPVGAGNLVRAVLAHRVQFIAFCINGLACAAIYSIVVWTLVALSRRTFALDVVIAYAITAVCNYLGSRLVFRPTTSIHGHLARYVTVVAANFTITAVLAYVLHRIDSPDIVAAYLPVAVTAVPTFFILRTWVFGRPPSVTA